MLEHVAAEVCVTPILVALGYVQCSYCLAIDTYLPCSSVHYLTAANCRGKW